MSKDIIITPKKIVDFARTQLFKDVDTILNVYEEDVTKRFTKEETIDILKTLILIGESFKDGQSYEECYKLYFERYLEKYEGRNILGYEIWFLDYFSYEGIILKHSSKKKSQLDPGSNYIYEEYLQTTFDNAIISFINDLKFRLEMVLMYTLDENIEDDDLLVNSSITFNENIIEPLYTLLKPHFDKTQHSMLNDVLNGIAIPKKITFNDGAIKLSDVFWKLTEKKYGLVIGNKTQLIKWLVKNFKFTDTDNIVKDMSDGTLKQYIHTQARKCEAPIIGIDKLIQPYK